MTRHPATDGLPSFLTTNEDKMIYTRYGSKIESVQWFDDENGEVGVIVETEGGKPEARSYHPADLKADGGIREIWDSARSIRNPRNPGTDPREV